MTRFINKVAIITGSARGIGYATAERLGRLGARVVISDVLEETLTEAASRLKGLGCQVLAKRCDVSNVDECQALVDATVEHFGPPDILINNAGVSAVANFEDCSPEVCRKIIDINLMGAIYMSLAALEHLKATRGHLVFVSSVSGIRAIPTGSIYSASKAGLRSLGESLRLELKPHGVHVGVIYPGFTTSVPDKTVMTGSGSPRAIDRPPHDTPEGVARGIIRMLEKRKAELVLTPLGKTTALLQRVSPTLVDRILAGRTLKN